MESFSRSATAGAGDLTPGGPSAPDELVRETLNPNDELILGADGRYYSPEMLNEAGQPIELQPLDLDADPALVVPGPAMPVGAPTEKNLVYHQNVTLPDAMVAALNDTLDMMILIGGPEGDLAWYFKTQLFDDKTGGFRPFWQEPNRRGGVVTWRPPNGEAGAWIDPRGRLFLAHGPGFNAPVSHKYNMWIYQSTPRSRAWAMAYIVLAHELGHTVMGLNDPNADSGHMGAVIAAAENPARNHLQLYFLADAPFPQGMEIDNPPSGMWAYIGQRAEYSGNVSAPMDLAHLLRRINQKDLLGSDTNAQQGRSELNKVLRFRASMIGKLPDEVCTLGEFWL